MGECPALRVRLLPGGIELSSGYRCPVNTSIVAVPIGRVLRAANAGIGRHMGTRNPAADKPTP